MAGYTPPQAPWQYTDPREDQSKLEKVPGFFGQGGVENQWINQLLGYGQQYNDIYNQAMGGFDPRVTGQMDYLTQLQNEMTGGGFFGDDEEQIYKDLISGKTLAGQGGTMYDLIQEQFAGARGQARDYASSMGMAPTSGSAMSMMGNQLGQQDRAYAEQMMNQYMNMVGAGTSGLGQMGGEQLQRQQSAGNLGEWLSQFVEGSQQGRMGIGLQATQAQQYPYLNLLQMSQGEPEQPKKPSTTDTIIDVGTTLLPYFF